MTKSLLKPNDMSAIATTAQEQKQRKVEAAAAKVKTDTERERVAHLKRQKKEVPKYIEGMIRETAQGGARHYIYCLGTKPDKELVQHLLAYFADFTPTKVGVPSSHCICYDTGDWEEYVADGIQFTW